MKNLNQSLLAYLKNALPNLDKEESILLTKEEIKEIIKEYIEKCILKDEKT